MDELNYSTKLYVPVVNKEQVQYLKKIKKDSLTNGQSEKDNRSTTIILVFNYFLKQSLR